MNAIVVAHDVFYRGNYHRREFQKSSFSQTIALPEAVDPDQVSAKLENGLLTVTLHPTKAMQSKTIPIAG